MIVMQSVLKPSVPPADPPEQMSYQLTLEQLFPVVHHRESTAKTPDHYFSALVKYVRTDEFLNSVLGQLSADRVRAAVEDIGKYEFVFQPAYLAVLVLWRSKPFSRSKKTLVFLEQTRTKTMTQGSRLIEYAEAKSFDYFNLGEGTSSASLQEQKKQIQGLIQSVLASLKKHKKSPALIKNLIMQLPAYLEQKKQAESAPSVSIFPKASSNQTKESKQFGIKAEELVDTGTPDYETVFYPNINYSLSLALLGYISKNEDLAKITIFSFRAKILLYHIKKVVKALTFDRQNIRRFKDCLKELFVEFKQLVNQEVELNSQKVKHYFNKCNRQIEKIVAIGYSVASDRVTIQELKESVLGQLDNCSAVEISEIYQFKNIRNKYIGKKGDIGFTGLVQLQRNTLFTSLSNLKGTLESKLIYGRQYWVWVVQREFKRIAKYLQNEQFIESISHAQISCQQNSKSNLQLLVQTYEAVMTQQQRNASYTPHLKPQCYSHVYLVKYIAAAFAFQKYKSINIGSSISVESYAPPLVNLEVLNEHFTSLSYEMRRALAYLNEYWENNRNKTKFCYLDKKSSFSEYFKNYFKSNQTYQQKLNKNRAAFQTKLQQIKFVFDEFKQRYQQACMDYNRLRQPRNLCNGKCSIGFFNNHNKCASCKDYEAAEKKVVDMQNEPFIQFEAGLFERDNEADQMIWICVGEFKIEKKLCGVMKMLFQIQIPIIKKVQNLPNDCDHYHQQRTANHHPLNFHYKVKKCLNQKLFNCYQSQPIKYAHFYEKLTHSYNGHTKNQPIVLQLFSPPPSIFNHQLSFQQTLFSWMVTKPIKQNNIRQHQIYAMFNDKKTSAFEELKKMRDQMFVDLASIKVANLTQLPLLCEGILNRKIIINTLSSHQIARYIVNSTVGDFKAFRISFPTKTQFQQLSSDQQQVVQQLEDVQLESTEDSMIYESIKHLLQNYTSKWRYQDFFSLQVLGGLFSFLAVMIHQAPLVADIAQVAFNEYNLLRKKEVYADDVGTKVKYLYLARSIISCFNENICIQSAKACQIFARLLVQIRLNSKFCHSLQEKNTFKKLIKEYEHYLNRAVFENIQYCVRYYRQNINLLNEVVREVDASVSVNTVWMFLPDYNYIFVGRDGAQEYMINFFNGVVLKNGSESNQLPIKVRKNETIESIFEGSSDMEVFLMKNGAVRTSNSFGKQFPQEKETDVFFQFSFDGKQANQQSGSSQLPSLRIRTIFKNASTGQERNYLLIQTGIIQDCNLFIPQKYLQEYYCWLEESTDNLIFRKRGLTKMKEIGLVLLSNKQSSQSEVNIQIVEGRIVTEQFTHEPLSFILDRKNALLFQRMLITEQYQRQNKAIDILSKIELPQFIIQIYSPHSRTQIEFLLIRSNLKFVFSQQFGLVSQNYEGYAVAEQYSHHKLLPWSAGDKVNCLVLKKMTDSYRMSIQHNYFFVIPHHQIQKNGNIQIPSLYSSRSQLICYEIHDTFNDIRSKSRLAQLHIAALVCSFEGDICSQHFMLTNQQFAISLIRSCYSFNQLSEQEYSRLNNVYQMAEGLNYNRLVLCAIVLQSMSKQLLHITPGKSGVIVKKKDSIYQIWRMPETFSKKMENCSFEYIHQLEDDSVTKACKLNELQLYILGLDPQNIEIINNKKAKLRWQKTESLIIKLEQKHIKGIEAAITTYNKAIKDTNHLKRTILNFFKKKEDPNQQKLLDKLNIIKVNQNDTMNKEMREDLQNSYDSFLKYNQKYEKVELSQRKTIEMLITFFTSPKQKCQRLKRQLSERIRNIFKKFDQHLEMIFRVKHRLTEKDYVECLYDQKKIRNLYENISENDEKSLRDAMKYWVLLNLQIESFQRILHLLNQPIIDKTALFRQLQSPREEINKKNCWICFQAEMKIRIWRSQYDTYEHLKLKGLGSVSQLNMGQGKTQVIIPMLVLEEICEKQATKQSIPRINLLSSLIQEAQRNYFRFFSVTSFKIPCFSFKFSREIDLTLSSIKRIKQVFECLKNKGIILLDRQSCLSMILKVREEYLKQTYNSIRQIGIKRDQWLFEETQIFDIFDQVDAMMTPTKNFVYSIGVSQPLQGDSIRYEMARVTMEILCEELLGWLFSQKMIATEQSQGHCEKLIAKGQYPKGLRLLSTITSQQRIQLKSKIVKLLFYNKKYRMSELAFYDNLDTKEKEILVQYVTDSSVDDIERIKGKLPEDMNNILALRGLLAFGILQHCLSLRVGVEFGAPSAKHHKRVAVPYEAADMPSVRSQYAHPDLAILVSYIGYFQKGISRQQFQQSLNNLLSKSQSTQNYFFEKWLGTIKNKKYLPSSVKIARQINMDSVAQIDQLYKVFSRCRNTIVYWLNHCVFPKDLKQYEQSISASSWDISYVQRSIGFSGTKDNHWLLPERLKWQSSTNDLINGTDGKMIHLLLHHTLSVSQISDSDLSLWQRFCEDTLELIAKGVACIIDAGAILAGKSLEQEVVPWICNHDLFLSSKKFKGITFCDKNGVWKVFDANTRSSIQRGTSIPQRETFVIFDQARTRGADIKMKSDVKAVLSLSPNMTKDRLMQAAGRLRMLGRNQQLYIKATVEILACIGFKKEKSTKEQVRLLMSWCCQNALNENRKLLYPNSLLALDHYNTILTGEPQISHFYTSLQSMYAKALTEESVYRLHTIALTKIEQAVVDHKQVKKLTEKMKIYGEDYFSKSSNLTDICQRETQRQLQIQNIQEFQHEKLIPVPQVDKINAYKQDITTLKFKFDERLKFSTNFVKCTQLYNSQFSISSNELCKINYMLIKQNELFVISQMEANQLLQKGVQNAGPLTLTKKAQLNGQSILCRFNDLTFETPIIKEYGFQAALAHAQFFNGNETFANIKYVFDLIFNLRRQKILAKKASNKSAPFDLSISSIQPGKNSFFKNDPATPTSFFGTQNQSGKTNLFKNDSAIITSFFGSVNFSGNNKNQSKNTFINFPQVLTKDNCKQVDIYDMVSHFLRLRNLVQSKFLNSDLEKIMIQLKSQPNQRWSQ